MTHSHESRNKFNERIRKENILAGKCVRCFRETKTPGTALCDICRIIKAIGRLSTRCFSLEKKINFLVDNVEVKK